jgi:hypothetical protein
VWVRRRLACKMLTAGPASAWGITVGPMIASSSSPNAPAEAASISKCAMTKAYCLSRSKLPVRVTTLRSSTVCATASLPPTCGSRERESLMGSVRAKFSYHWLTGEIARIESRIAALEDQRDALPDIGPILSRARDEVTKLLVLPRSRRPNEQSWGRLMSLFRLLY